MLAVVVWVCVVTTEPLDVVEVVTVLVVTVSPPVGGGVEVAVVTEVMGVVVWCVVVEGMPWDDPSLT